MRLRVCVRTRVIQIEMSNVIQGLMRNRSCSNMTVHHLGCYKNSKSRFLSFSSSFISLLLLFGGITAGESNRINKLLMVRKASSVVGLELDSLEIVGEEDEGQIQVHPGSPLPSPLC
jgi:hypothetical protein